MTAMEIMEGKDAVHRIDPMANLCFVSYPLEFVKVLKSVPKVYSTNCFLLGETYTEDEYTYQFTFGCGKWIAKLDRVIERYRKMDPNTPAFVFEKWDAAKDEIEAGTVSRPCPLSVEFGGIWKRDPKDREHGPESSSSCLPTSRITS